MPSDELSQSFGRSRQGPRLNFSTCPIVLLVTLGSLMVMIGALGAQQGKTFESPLAKWMVLSLPAMNAPGLFLHSFFHAQPLHLSGVTVSLLWAGSILEARWGSVRFTIFYAFVTLSSALVGVLILEVRSIFQAERVPELQTTFALFGGGAAAVACLAVASRTEHERWLLGWLSTRYLFWILIVLGSTALVVLESGAFDDGNPRLFLLPQVSGLAFGLVFLWTLPRADRMVANWRAARRRAAERVLVEMRTRVDQLLDKINADGLESLSPEEKSFLRHASKHYKRPDEL